jgi:hypothetical protein
MQKILKHYKKLVSLLNAESLKQVTINKELNN